MKRIEAINLYSAISDTKIGHLENETVSKYIDFRIAIKDIPQQLEAYKSEVIDQLKPKDWKDGDDIPNWNKKGKPLIEKWLIEKTDIDAKIFSTDEIISFVKENELSGQVMDMIVELMRK